MEEDHRTIRLRDILRSRKGGPTFRVLLFIFGSALKLFFRRIETVNEHLVPDGTGVIFVLNHPNGLIDPALVFVALPRKISFLAKSTLFRMPVISFLLKQVEALPVYRRMDAGEDVSQNLKTFAAARDLLKRGGSIALFPEGVSHNSSKMLPAKTGAARIALGAASMNEDGGKGVQIVPVGLYYTSKTTFRSEALLHFGKAFRVPSVTLDADGDPPREDVKALTAKIEDALREVTINAETEAELNTADAARGVFFSANGSGRELHKRQIFLQRYIGDQSGERPPELAELDEKIVKFEQKLAALKLQPEHLSLSRFTRGFVVKQAFLQTWYLLVLAPVAVIGALLHTPAYQLCKLFAAIYSRHGADDVASTVKVLAGLVFMPLTWLIVAGAVYYFCGWQAAVLSVPTSFLTGYIALVTLEDLEELRGWARAIRMFFTKKESFLRLYVERNDLQEGLQRLGLTHE
ncbi:MAG: 1-acyl-sn-glycerol-3-phosphate acyltransferase [Acidobacteria bacterium]|nr:1-acyl-sn-glycerol-3-phosphate acyltransferase [Acidobacteriota bacterium]